MRFFRWFLFCTLCISSVGANAQYCTLPTSNCLNFHTTRVILANLDNSSACSVDGYTDYRALVAPANVNAGTLVPIKLEMFTSPSFSSSLVMVGADFNGNFLFDSSEVFYFSGRDSAKGVLRIPFNAQIGTTLLRVRTVSGNTGNPNICGNAFSSEIEDYVLNILPPATAGPNFNLYVNAAATGSNTGQNWQNAFTSLSHATYLARGGDTVKVAQGTYYPGSDASHYLIVRDSVKLLGGFPNTGNPGLQQRDYSRFPTILSGNIGSPSGNSQTILSSPFSFDIPALNFAVDGFIIEGARSSAFRSYSSKGEVRNCVIRNSATAIGMVSGIVNFTNCVIEGNQGSSSNSYSLDFSNAEISFRNSVITGNRSANKVIRVQNSRINFDNSVFTNNSTIYSPGSIIDVQNNGTVNLRNSIFYNSSINDTITHPEITFTSGSTVSVENSITQVFPNPQPHLYKVNPFFKDEYNVAGPDNLYFTSDDGLIVQSPCSPAINQGNDQFVTGIPLDIAGNNRIAHGQVDLGPWEAQIITPVPVVYVNNNATGMNNGTSWANAFIDVQMAIRNCADTVKIAAGTYVPSTTSNDHAFELRNNQIWMGGYPATGNPTDAMRDPSLHKTIFSGNIEVNGSPDASSRIIYGFIVDSTSVVDGIHIGDPSPSAFRFRITALELYNFASPKIVNCIFSDVGKAFEINDSSKPVIYNTRVSNNFDLGTFRRSAPRFIGCHFSGNNDPNVTLMHFYETNARFDNTTFVDNAKLLNGWSNSRFELNNCFFKNNLSTMLVEEGSSVHAVNTIFDSTNTMSIRRQSSSFFEHCVFKNYSTGTSGFFTNDDVTSVFRGCAFENIRGWAINNLNNSNLDIINCISSTQSSSSSFRSFLRNDASTAHIRNSSIVNGVTSGQTPVISNNNSGTVNISNSIFWGHLLGALPNTDFNGSGFNVVNTLTQQYGSTGVNGNLVGVQPRFIDIMNLKGPDGIYFTADDGLRLSQCSPLVDAGSNAQVSGITEDILNNNRIINGMVDMGAYETNNTVGSGRVVFVNRSATGNNDGTSWTNAFTNLQSAFASTCSDTIKIAAGEYKPAVSDRDSAFHIYKNFVLLGGYPSSGNPSDASRNVDLYPTILSGDIGLMGDSSDNSFHLVTINAQNFDVEIDGLHFRFGFANGGAPGGMFQRSQGPAVNSYSCRTLNLLNCRFYGNTASSNIVHFPISAEVNIKNCVFEENKVHSPLLSIESLSTHVSNCIFIGNTMVESGCINVGNVPVGIVKIPNCIFFRNSSLTGGAGIYIESNNSTEVANCDFIENNSSGSIYGISLFAQLPSNPSQYPKITNCNFYSQLYLNSQLNTSYADWVNMTQSGPDTWGLYTSNSSTISGGGYTWANISPSIISYINLNDPVGPDNEWFTEDDGLRMDRCSGGINVGDNNYIIGTTDIRNLPRISEGIVDLGAFEQQSGSGSVTISPSASTICAGMPVTFTAIAGGSGSNLNYQWQINSVDVGTSQPTYTSSSLADDDTVRCIVSNSSGCNNTFSDTSNVIVMDITVSVLPEVTLSASASTLCSGDSVTFSTSQINGGAQPEYAWLLNGTLVAGQNQPTLSTTSLSSGDEISVVLSSSLQCAVPVTDTSEAISILILPIPIANAGSDTSICAGSSLQLNASGGTVYNWLPASGLSNASIPNPLALPASTGAYVVEVSDGGCSSMDTIIITVLPLQTLTVNVTPSSSSVCSGDMVVFQSDVANGGTSPTYGWFINSNPVGGNNPSLNSAVSNGDSVWVTVNSNALCLVQNYLSSNIVVMHVDSMQVPQLFLSSGQLTITNPEPLVTYTLQNFSNGVWVNLGSGSNLSYSISAPGEYRVMGTKGNCTKYSDAVNSARQSMAVFVYPNPAQNTINIEISDPATWMWMQLFNNMGQPVSGQIPIAGRSTIPLGINHLQAGTYFIRLSNGQNNHLTVSFVKL